MDRSVEQALATRKRLLFIAAILVVISELLAAVGVGAGFHSEFPAYVKHGNFFLSACLFAGAIVYAASGPPRTERFAALGLGALLEVAHALARGSGGRYVTNAGAGFGLAALIVSAVSALRAAPEGRTLAKLRVAEVALFPAFLLVARLFVELTVVLHPVSADARFLYADLTTFGGQPSFAWGRVLSQSTLLRVLEAAVYIELPVAAAVVYIFERRAGRRAGDIQTSFLIAGLAGVVLYHLCPVAGPKHAFSPTFPAFAPLPEAVLKIPYLAGATFRNAIPSLHTTWALLIYWHARPHGTALRIAAALWAVLTVGAMLGLGEHYLIDVFVSIPFAVAVRAALATEVPLRARERLLPIGLGALLFLSWIVVFHGPVAVLGDSLILRTMAALSAIGPLLLERRLYVREQLAPDKDPAPVSERPVSVSGTSRGALVASEASGGANKGALTIALVFFTSGFAGLIYEVVFAKTLALVFGSTAVASSTVLATYMGGMALGSYLGARVRTRSALRGYAACELGVGIACLIAPFLAKAVKASYIALASGADPGRPSLVLLQVGLGALVLLPPTVLMGMTLPLLSRYFRREDPTLGRSVALLYGANTAGASVGAMLTGYLLIPNIGIFMTLLLGVIANFGVALAALRLDVRRTSLQRATDSVPSDDTPEPPSNEAKLDPEANDWQRLRRIGLFVLAIGGVVSLGLEVTYTHLLAVVVGNSAFAFSSMLAAFLVGLAAGAAAGRAWMRRALPIAVGIALAQAGIAVAVLGGVFAWDLVPEYFASYAGFGPARNFATSEFIRFAVCCALLVPPAAFIGASYPLAMDCAVRSPTSADRVRLLGIGAALNTVGNITGALVTGFVLMPKLGALRTLHALMFATIGLSLIPLLVVRGRMRIPVIFGAATAIVLALLQPRSFDLTRLASGANVYFMAQTYGEVIDHAESMEGGLTTVALAIKDGRPVKTLLTNGKFQGDDSSEMTAQFAFTLLPLLHTAERGRALAIGLGTGVSARVMRDAGFRDIDVAELSGDLVDVARRHFGKTNAGVLERSDVHLFVTDGRNYLMLQPQRYDLIGLELTSIWFAGAAALYNREFYELAKTRLTPKGVLQQWIQMHHLERSDVVSVLASIRRVFPKVWLYLAGNQGVLVACEHDCRPSAETLAALDAREPLAEGLRLLGGTASRLLSYRLLTPEAIDRLLTSLGGDPSDNARLDPFVSDDDNLALEYHTPRGNMSSYATTLAANVAALKAFAPKDPFAGTVIAPPQP